MVRCAFSFLNFCRRLSLSTNQIEKLFPFSGMTNLQILSLGRNNIKKLEKLDDLAPTLQQLWVSYNQISNLDGVLPLTNLEVLYMSNNQIKDWGEIEKLVRPLCIGRRVFRFAGQLCHLCSLSPKSTCSDFARFPRFAHWQAALPHLREVLFVGNPIYEGMDDETARLNVIKRIPQVRPFVVSRVLLWFVLCFPQRRRRPWFLRICFPVGMVCACVAADSKS